MFGENARKYGTKTLAIGALFTLVGTIVTAVATGKVADLNWIELGMMAAMAMNSFGVFGSRANGVASEEVATNPMSIENDLLVPLTAMQGTGTSVSPLSTASKK